MSKQQLAISDIVFMSIAALIGIRWFSTAAKYGAGSILLWFLAAILFMIPMSFICAEFSSVFPDKKGGLTDWIKEIVGEKTAFYTSWLFFSSFFFYYSSILTFSAMAFAQVFKPELANSKLFITCYILFMYWGIALIVSSGIKFISKFSKFGAFFGNILPVFIILGIGAVSVFIFKEKIPTDFSLKSFIPHFNSSNLMFLSTLTLALAGVEVTSPLSNSLKNPGKDYPKAVVISAFLVAAIYILGTISMNTVLSPDQINAASGIFSVIATVAEEAHLPFIGRLICFLIFLATITAPMVILLATTKLFAEGNSEKYLPAFLIKENKNEIPINIIWTQGIVISLLVIATNFLPTVELVYSVLIMMFTITMFIPYLFLSYAYIKMKFGKKIYTSVYKVPFGKPGGAIFVGLIIIMTLTTILIPIFSPPENESLIAYEIEVAGGPLLIVFLGWIISKCAAKAK